jgi:hypothetical protein
MKYKIEDIIKAVERIGYSIIREGNTDYRISEKTAYYKNIASTWTKGTKLIRISNSRFYLEEVIFEKQEDDTDICIIYEGKILGGNNFYRFIPASWVTPKKSYLPEWL